MKSEERITARINDLLNEKRRIDLELSQLNKQREIESLCDKVLNIEAGYLNCLDINDVLYCVFDVMERGTKNHKPLVMTIQKTGENGFNCCVENKNPSDLISALLYIHTLMRDKGYRFVWMKKLNDPFN